MNPRSRIQRFVLVFATVLTMGWATSLPVRQVHAASHLARAAAKDRGSKRLGTKIDTYLKGLAAKNQLSGAVLVARKGKVILAKGYGMAVREKGIPNSPTIKYPLPGISFSLSLVAGLRLEDQGKLKDSASVCSYLPSCPDSWKAMTVGMVLDGTSGLGDAGWGQPGNTTAQSLAHCQHEPLTAAPGRHLGYQNCTAVVLGTVFEKLSRRPWAAFMRQEVFGPAGMTNSGRMTDSLVPPARAQDYSGSEPDSDVVYNDYFQVYGTVRDVYAYENALFGGTLLSRKSLHRLVAARGAVNPADAHISNERQASKWKVGSFLGHQVILITDHTKSFTGANFRFPKEGVTVIVISNDDQNDVEDVAVHAAAMVFGKPIPAPPPSTAPAVDPAKAIVATINVPHAFGYLVSSDNGALWIGGDQTGMVTRLDPATNHIVGTVKVNDPSTAPGIEDAGIVLVASGSGQLWATDRVNKAVARIDPATNQITARVPIGIEPSALAIAGGNLWVTGSSEGQPDIDTIVHLDLGTEKVLARITSATTELGQPFPYQVAATPDALWFADSAGGTIKRLDATTNKVTATIHAGPQPGFVASGEGAIWIAYHSSDLITRIDPATNKVVASIPLHGYPPGHLENDFGGDVAVGAGAVWTMAGSSGRVLVRIDPQTNEATASLTFPQGIFLVGAAAGSAWVQSGDSDSAQLYRVNATVMKGP